MIKGHLYIQRKPLSRILEKPHQNRHRRRETKNFAAELECDPQELISLAFSDSLQTVPETLDFDDWNY
jgi:hypothetical protein